MTPMSSINSSIQILLLKRELTDVECRNLTRYKNNIIGSFNEAEISTAIKKMKKSPDITMQAFSRAILYEAKKIDADEAFPYSIIEKANIRKKRYEPTAKHFIKNPETTEDPGYVLNIPSVTKVKLGEEADYTNLNEMIKKIEEQSFEKTAAESKEKIKNCLRVVVGCNRFKSIDGRPNKLFKAFIKGFDSNSKVVNLFGFFWKPCWKNKKGEDVHLKELKTYYRALRRLLPEMAETWREEQEKKITEFIPYCGIRESIKNSNYTKKCIKKLRKISSERDIYLALLDADFKRLKTRDDDIGLYSVYNELIKTHAENYGETPTVASTGYRASPEELSILLKGIYLDRLVREAIASILPLGIYFPEPNMIIKLIKRRIQLTESFGDNKGRESLQLIQNIFNSRVRLRPQKALAFQSKGPIITTIPDRFMCKKYDTLPVLNKKTIHQKRILKSLKGIRQSHAVTLEGWAKNVIRAIDYNKKDVPAVRHDLCEILNQFDPINLIFNQYVTDKYSIKHFRDTMATYEIYINMIKNCKETLYNDVLDIFMESEDEEINMDNYSDKVKIAVNNTLNTLSLNGRTIRNEYTDLYNNRLDSLHEATLDLLKRQVPLNQVKQIVKAAEATGKAIYGFLKNIYDPV